MKDLKRLQDIFGAIEHIESYSVASFDDFQADSRTQEAI